MKYKKPTTKSYDGSAADFLMFDETGWGKYKPMLPKGKFYHFGPITAYKSNGFFWLKIFGHGLKIKDTKKSPRLFSERYGYQKGVTIGKYFITLLNSKPKKYI